VQAVGELDQDHPDIPGHRQQHLAEAFGLPLLAGAKGHLADLGHPVDQVEDLRTEHGADFFGRGQGVFQGVVQQPGDDGRHVELQAGEDFSDFEGVIQIRFTGEAGLPLMHLGTEHIRLAQCIEFGRRVIGADPIEDIVEANHSEAA